MDVERTMEELYIAPEPDGETVRAEPGHRGSKRAVFLDRDGVLNVDTVHLHRKEEMMLIDGVPAALGTLKEMGFCLVVVTNQAGIAKGLFSFEDFLEVMLSIKESIGGRVPWDRAYFCPYSEEGVIDRYVMSHVDRKPGPGMLLRAAAELDIDLPSSFMIGDHAKDIAAAHRAGCKGILVMTGRGRDELKELVNSGALPGDERWPDLITQDLLSASKAIEGGII